MNNKIEQNTNFDDVLERDLIISLLYELSDKLKIKTVWFDKNGLQNSSEIAVPFYLSITGDERFLMDSFMKSEICADGKLLQNYSVVPRGIVTQTSSDIDIGSRTNPFVMGKFMKEVVIQGNIEPKKVYAIFSPIPIKINYDVKIKCDNYLNMLKISQNIKKALYKNYRFNFWSSNVLVPAVVSFPESVTNESPIEYNNGDITNIEISFSLECSTFIPHFHSDTEITDDNRMNIIEQNITDNNFNLKNVIRKDGI